MKPQLSKTEICPDDKALNEEINHICAKYIDMPVSGFSDAVEDFSHALYNAGFIPKDEKAFSTICEWVAIGYAVCCARKDIKIADFKERYRKYCEEKEKEQGGTK